MANPIVDAIQTVVASGAWPRMRLSSWMDPRAILKNNVGDWSILDNGTEVLDDVSLLTTFRNGDNSIDDAFVFDPLLMSGLAASSKATATQFIQDTAAECHKRRIQCLVGYTAVDGHGAGFKAFNDWLNNVSRSKPNGKPTSVADVAQKVVDFFTTNCVDANDETRSPDGISFDLEVLTASPEGTESKDDALKRVGDTLTDFFRQVASGLGTDRILGIAGGGLVDDNGHARGTLRALGGAIIHQYAVAEGQPNILFRPMAYDININTQTSFDDLAIWHGQIIDYANTKKIAQRPFWPANLQPNRNIGTPQFQLGVKTGPNVDASTGAVKPPPDDTNGNVSRNPDILADPSLWPVLMFLGSSGMIFFPTSANLWQKVNKVINGPNKTGRLGAPLQVPLTAGMLKRMPANPTKATNPSNPANPANPSNPTNP
jgi:hypothetical protein